MRNKDFGKFLKTGSINDYLKYVKEKKKNSDKMKKNYEFSTEISMKDEKNDFKGRNNFKEY